MSTFFTTLKEVIGPIFSVAGPIATISLAIYVYIHSQRRDVKVYIGNSISLLDAELFKEHGLEVSCKGISATDLRLTDIRVINRGRVHIAPADYYEPLKVYFGPEACVLSAKLIAPFSKQTDEIARWHGNDPGMTDRTRLEFHKVLLNAGDVIDIRVLVSNSLIAKPEGKIAGVKSIHPEPYSIIGLGALGIRSFCQRMAMRSIARFAARG